MNTTFRYSVMVVLCFGALLVSVGCKPTVTVRPSLVTIEVGETIALEAVSTSDKDTSFTWTSKAPTIASVDSSGVVSGVDEGQTTVIVRGDSSGVGLRRSGAGSPVTAEPGGGYGHRAGP